MSALPSFRAVRVAADEWGIECILPNRPVEVFSGYFKTEEAAQHMASRLRAIADRSFAAAVADPAGIMSLTRGGA